MGEIDRDRNEVTDENDYKEQGNEKIVNNARMNNIIISIEMDIKKKKEH